MINGSKSWNTTILRPGGLEARATVCVCVLYWGGGADRDFILHHASTSVASVITHVEMKVQ